MKGWGALSLGAAGLVALWCAAPIEAEAQIAREVLGLEDGVVHFSYAIREGVEICDDGIRTGHDRGEWRDYRYQPRNCRTGVAEVELEVRRGLVRDVEIVQDLAERTIGAVSLGEIGAREVRDYLLSLPYGGSTGDGAEEAIFPATIADAEETWRTLVELAKDRSLDSEVREQALFWLGQDAADAATAGLSDVALADDEEQEVRNAAVFALSQRSEDEAISALIEVARTGSEGETRRTAMFWLAQLDDERVVRFFEDVLLGRIR